MILFPYSAMRAARLPRVFWKHFDRTTLMIVATCWLVAFPSCDLAPPSPTLEFDDGLLTIHLETLGEYPSTVSRIQITEDNTKAVVWEVVATNGKSQLWSFDLRAGGNSILSSNLPEGEYTQTVPEGQREFGLELGTKYRLRAWGEGKKCSSVTFSLDATP